MSQQVRSFVLASENLPFPSSKRKRAKSSALGTFILLATILATSLAVAVGFSGNDLDTMPRLLCADPEPTPSSSGGISTRMLQPTAAADAAGDAEEQLLLDPLPKLPPPPEAREVEELRLPTTTLALGLVAVSRRLRFPVPVSAPSSSSPPPNLCCAERREEMFSWKHDC